MLFFDIQIGHASFPLFILPLSELHLPQPRRHVILNLDLPYSVECGVPWNEMKGFMHGGQPVHSAAPSTNPAQKVAEISYVSGNPCF